MRQQFYLRLNGPRATFPGDMTDAERALMQQHGAYVQGFFDAGLVLAYGPVMDPAGAFGVALIDAADQDEVERFMANDPSVLAGMNTWKLFPMHIAASQKAREV